MGGKETTTDLLAKELRDLDVEVKELTQGLSIGDVEILKNLGRPFFPGSRLTEKIRAMYHRIKELENALNTVC